MSHQINLSARNHVNVRRFFQSKACALNSQEALSVVETQGMQWSCIFIALSSLGFPITFWSCDNANSRSQGSRGNRSVVIPSDPENSISPQSCDA